MLDFAEQVSISERVKVTSGKRFYSTGLRALDFVSKHMLQLKPGATTFSRMTFSRKTPTLKNIKLTVIVQVS
jgi:hypothetical protein